MSVRSPPAAGALGISMWVTRSDYFDMQLLTVTVRNRVNGHADVPWNSYARVYGWLCSWLVCLVNTLSLTVGRGAGWGGIV